MAMAHPVVWPKKLSFHPINDGPPVCLTQGLSPEKPAEILLLGCGDPSGILYTVFADLASKNRPLDITCCDWEPAVLARDILLLTIIIDGDAVEEAWSVFYHFFLDKTSHDTLISQCHTLIHSSSTLKTWRKSKYGQFLRFCTEHSLAKIRRHWVLYLESQNDTEEERKALKESFSSAMKSSLELYGDHVDSSRAAGPLYWPMVVDNHASQSHKDFWTTGITSSELSREATPYVNPTFVYSVAGKKFNVHRGTNPIMAFHLAPVFCSGNRGQKRQLSKSLTTDDFVECAKSQFSAWCSSFRTRLSSGSAANIVIRFFVGESLAFCQALHICKEQKTTETGIYAHPWGGSPIVFDDDYRDSSPTAAPLLFNVIETSDLADHVGIVNLLVAAVPLLQKTPWSTIHTFTSLWSYPGNSPQSTLSNNVCGDVPTFSMLLGVAPSTHLWHFTPHSNKHGTIGPNKVPSELHESICWRFISSFIPNVPPISDETDTKYFNFMCDEHTLAKYFFAIYLRMFADEDLTALRDIANKGYTLNPNRQDFAAVHYTRASFVALLALVKGSVRVDWAQTMNHLIDLIGNDKTLVIGLNSYQDLSCQLHMRNVHTFQVPALDIEPLRTSHDRFQGWKDVPPIVCVVLKVPRRLLKHVEDMNVDDIVTPMLQCEVHGSDFHNVYSSIHLTFGDTLSSIVDGESQVTLEEDPHGWSGTSPLIATFYVPSWTLTSAPTATLVGFHFRGALSTQSLSLLTTLGSEGLAIFSTSLMDKSHVQIVRYRPNNAQEIEHLCNTNGYNAPKAPINRNDITLKFEPTSGRAASLIMRKNITEPNPSRELAGDSKVSMQPLSDSSILVAFGDDTHRFDFAFAVHTDRSLMRIVRESSYIEIESLIRPDFSDFHNISRNPFAMAYDHNQINLLNIHYINLDSLPTLVIPSRKDKNHWMGHHFTMMYSGAERREKETCVSPEDCAPLVNLKTSITNLLVLYTKSHIIKQRTSVFCLLDPRNTIMDTLFFVNAVKFDLGSHTVVVDACAVPLKKDTKLHSAMTAILKKGIIPGINKSYNEIRLWKLLMPTLAERCRTWKHTETCEYRTKGIPASLEGLMHSPLCSCGKGKNLGWFGTVAEWAPFHGEATRIAIGPLFTFSFIEDTVRAVANGKLSQTFLQKKLCARCGRIGRPSLQTCSACLKVRYCSPECQRAHWQTHKPACLAARLAT